MRRRHSALVLRLLRKPSVLPLRARLALSSGFTRLHAQTSRQHELADGSAEAGEECVEGLCLSGVWLALRLSR